MYIMYSCFEIFEKHSMPDSFVQENSDQHQNVAQVK